jgi:hypothetical protein
MQKTDPCRSELFNHRGHQCLSLEARMQRSTPDHSSAYRSRILFSGVGGEKPQHGAIKRCRGSFGYAPLRMTISSGEGEYNWVEYAETDPCRSELFNHRGRQCLSLESRTQRSTPDHSSAYRSRVLFSGVGRRKAPSSIGQLNAAEVPSAPLRMANLSGGLEYCSIVPELDFQNWK